MSSCFIGKKSCKSFTETSNGFYRRRTILTKARIGAFWKKVDKYINFLTGARFHLDHVRQKIIDFFVKRAFLCNMEH